MRRIGFSDDRLLRAAAANVRKKPDIDNSPLRAISIVDAQVRVKPRAYIRRSSVASVVAVDRCASSATGTGVQPAGHGWRPATLRGREAQFNVDRHRRCPRTSRSRYNLSF
jgi:Holliday junction resolvase